VNPLLSAEEQAARDSARARALELFGGVGAVSAEAVAEVVAGVVGNDDVAATLLLALVVEETARVDASAGAAVANAATAALLLQHTGSSTTGLAAVVAGDSVEGVSEPAAAVMLADAYVVLADNAVWLAEAADGSPVDLDGLRNAAMGTVLPGAVTRIGGADEYERGRGLMLLQQAAVAVGLCAAAQDVALAAIAAGKAAGERPDRSQAVQWGLADIVTDGEAARVAVWHAACDEATDNAAAMALVLAADGAVASARRAAQIGGIDGLGADSAASRLQRDSKLMELLGGGTEAHLAIIADALLPDVPRA